MRNSFYQQVDVHSINIFPAFLINWVCQNRDIICPWLIGISHLCFPKAPVVFPPVWHWTEPIQTPANSPLPEKTPSLGVGKKKQCQETWLFSQKVQAQKDAEKRYNNSERFHFFQRMLWLDLLSYLYHFTHFYPCCISYILSLLKREAEKTENQQKSPPTQNIPTHPYPPVLPPKREQ